jgi:hypothetical protein
MNEFKIGEKVVCPVSNDDGEITHVMGELIKINSRFAHVRTDIGVVKVGKTKIEKCVDKTHKEKEYFCPKCNKSHLECFENGDPDLEPFKTNKYWCQECDVEFGPRINRKPSNCKTSKGRNSLDNGDRVALMLRGKQLEVVYEIAAKLLNISKSELLLRYNHLNPGQQRMCLGNRLRKI